MFEVVWYRELGTFHLADEGLTEMVEGLFDSGETLELGRKIGEAGIQFDKNLSESFLSERSDTYSRYFSLSNFLERISFARCINRYLDPLGPY